MNGDSPFSVHALVIPDNQQGNYTIISPPSYRINNKSGCTLTRMPQKRFVVTEILVFDFELFIGVRSFPTEIFEFRHRNAGARSG
jgi:hypothetical protein